MKLINKEDPVILVDLFESSLTSEEQIRLLVDELRLVEDKFYKIFDLSPCPMMINDSNGLLIDVNQSFLNITNNIKDKKQILGKLITENGLNFIKEKEKDYIVDCINNDGCIKNHLIKFRTLKGKKLNGLCSCSRIELNGKDCILTILQVVSKKCLLNFIF